MLLNLEVSGQFLRVVIVWRVTIVSGLVRLNRVLSRPLDCSAVVVHGLFFIMLLQVIVRALNHLVEVDRLVVQIELVAKAVLIVV